MFPTTQTNCSWADWPPVRSVEEAYAFLDAMGLALFHRFQSPLRRVPKRDAPSPQRSIAAVAIRRRAQPQIPALSDVLAPEPEIDGHPMIWKDILHEARRVYFGTTVRGETSFVVPELLPAFYRLQGLSADDYLERYDRGVIDMAAVRVLRALLDEGQLSTRALRRAARLNGPGEKPAFVAATNALRRTLTITVAFSKSRQRTGYEYVWDVFERLWPEVSEAAVVRYPDPAGAIRAVAERCGAWLDHATDVCALMDWPQHSVTSTQHSALKRTE